jgi:hypothetical protein
VNSSIEQDGIKSSLKEHDTPIVKTPLSHDDSGMKSVKFGDAPAAEFD